MTLTIRKASPEFQAYLSAHPDVSTALNQNPHDFMKTVQQPATTPTTGATGTTGTTKPSTTTTPETKPPTKP